jgi:hypothetical protein
MPNGVQWTTARIAEARKRHPSVTAAASARIAQLLAGRLSEEQLSPAELLKVASALLADMIPARAKTDAEQ